MARASQSISGCAPDARRCLPRATPTVTSEMLETAQFGLLVHHDDPDREFAYDTGATHALAEAGPRGWTVVSMKSDWQTVF